MPNPTTERLAREQDRLEQNRAAAAQHADSFAAQTRPRFAGGKQMLP